jgi:hypothetical protein
VYSRAGLWRIAPIIVAPWLTAASTNVLAREFRAARAPSISTVAVE